MTFNKNYHELKFDENVYAASDYRNFSVLAKLRRQHNIKLEQALGRAHTFANATLSEDRELKSGHYGVGFKRIGRKLSAL